MEQRPKDFIENFTYAKKSNWKNPDILYLKNCKITEWDIKSAGLSVLKFRKLLPDDELKNLEALPKNKRTYKEGMLQKKNPKIAEEIVETLEKVRQYFAAVNNIYINDVLSIKKDAIFLINKTPQITKIKEFFEFRQKGVFTSYIRIDNKEFLYNTYSGEYSVKGFSEDILKFQEKFFIGDILNFLKLSEKVRPENLYKIMSSYREKYLNRKLPKETYREMISGKFRMNNYLMDEIDDDMINDIDISQNYLQFFVPLCEFLL